MKVENAKVQVLARSQKLDSSLSLVVVEVGHSRRQGRVMRLEMFACRRAETTLGQIRNLTGAGNNFWSVQKVHAAWLRGKVFIIIILFESQKRLRIAGIHHKLISDG